MLFRSQAAETARRLTVHQVDRLTSDSEKQSHQIGETLMSVEEMIRSIQQVADHARLVVEMVQASTRNAQEGETAIEMTSGDLSKLKSLSNVDTILELQDYTDRISQSTIDLDRITQQTRKIALFLETESHGNGIGGRELSYTIEEINVLATHSAAVTRGMKGLLTQIQSHTNMVTQAVESDYLQVDRMTQPIDETKQNLASIVEVSQQIDLLVRSIAAATVSQSVTARNVKKIVKKISGRSTRLQT